MQHSFTFFVHTPLMILCALLLNTSITSTVEAFGFENEIQEAPLSREEYANYIRSLGLDPQLTNKLIREYKPQR